MKTEVSKEEYKGNAMFVINQVDGEGEKVGSYSVVSFGIKKAAAILKHIDDLKKFVKENE